MTSAPNGWRVCSVSAVNVTNDSVDSVHPPVIFPGPTSENHAAQRQMGSSTIFDKDGHRTRCDRNNTTWPCSFPEKPVR